MNQPAALSHTARSATDTRAFTRDFFTLFGAHVRDDGDTGLEVHLPPEMAAHFGKARLSLAFSVADLASYQELVVSGSRIFDQMIAWLANRGERTLWRLPVRNQAHAIDDSPPPELTWVNCTVDTSDARTQEELFFVFNFRLVYTADDRREEIHTAVLDAHGQPRPEMRALVHPPTEIDWPQPVPSDWLSPATPPTLSQLTKLAHKARSLAVAQAKTRAETLEHELHHRLYRVLARLQTYYQRQTEELIAGDETRADEIRDLLTQELQRKMAEELENHRLRLQVQLLSLAQIGRPVRHHSLTLRSPHASHTLTVQRDLNSGELTPLLCHACGQPTTHLALCAGGHVAGADCVSTCRDCQRDRCTACGIQGCVVCSQPVCNDCKHICHLCGGWACSEHASLCPVCQRIACADHTFYCRICGQPTCASCRARRNVCHTCATLALALPHDMAAWPAELIGLQQRYSRWQVAQNTRYRIYRGARFLGQVVVVQDRRTHEVISIRQRGLLAR
ncbi:MAG: hypothetical protein ACOYZ7_07695 [Chloroflexota bacterium]